MLYTVERVGNQLFAYAVFAMEHRLSMPCYSAFPQSSGEVVAQPDSSTPTGSQQPCVHGQSSTHDMRLSDIRPRTYAGIFELWRYFQRLEGCRVS